MALIAAKCTNCGSAIEVDNTKEAGICRFCNTAFITEKVINNYVTNINKTENVTQYVTKNIYGSKEKPPIDYLAEADILMKRGSYSTAFWGYKKALTQSTPDPRIYEKIFEVLKQMLLCGDVDSLLNELKNNEFLRFFKIYKTLVSSEKAEQVKADYQASINLDSAQMWTKLINNELEDFEESGYDTIAEWLESKIEDIEWMVEDEEIKQATAAKLIKALKKYTPDKLPQTKKEQDEEDDIY